MRARRIDNTQTEIVKALRDNGRDVIVVNGVFDLVVGHKGMTFILDCKTKETRHKLTPSQEKWLKEWTGGPICIVYTPQEALEATQITVLPVA
jgi:Holliday junction resolvase